MIVAGDCLRDCRGTACLVTGDWSRGCSVLIAEAAPSYCPSSASFFFASGRANAFVGLWAFTANIFL